MRVGTFSYSDAIAVNSSGKMGFSASDRQFDHWGLIPSPLGFRSGEGLPPRGVFSLAEHLFANRLAMR